MSELERLIGLSASALGVLLPAFKLVEQMTNTYKAIKFAKARCKAVIFRAAFMIKGVHESAHKTGMDIPSPHLKELNHKLEDVQVVMQKLAEMSFLKALLRSDMISQEIEMADRHLTDCLHIFQIELLFRAQTEKENAAKSDRAALQDLLTELKGNYYKFRRVFGINNDGEENQAMVAMEKKLSETEHILQNTVETQIIKSGLECIKSSTGKNTPKQSPWLITEYELDFGDEIGGGGFATVRKAKFRGTMVAVKVLKRIGDLKKDLEREVDIWSRLRHDHIVPFYGASTLTSSPFIVSRYMRNGNLIRYLARQPNADRTRLVYEISLGMFYLHGEKIVHGDLKGVNVLVDDAGKACIADFGLSSINSAVVPGTTTNKVSGTLRYMAPEALRGQRLDFATDVYAFGMVIYEVFAGEGPFVGVSDNEVMQGNLTLTRPTTQEASANGLNDDIWQLVLDTSNPNGPTRPLFGTITKRLEPVKDDLFSGTIQPDNDIFSEGQTTNWAMGPTLYHSQMPLIKEEVAADKTRSTSTSSLVFEFNSERPICIDVYCRHFNVEFGLLRKGPAVYVEENGSSHWQPISAKKGSLLRDEGNRFTYRRSIGEGTNSWELNDAYTAKKWFDLQLSYARDGSVAIWGSSTANGEWNTKVRSWRRVVGGKLQSSAPVDEASNLVPSSWGRVELVPKRYVIDSIVDGTITCIVNRGSSRSSKSCWSVRGRTITLTTYRFSIDKTPSMTKEETYSTEGEAGVMFNTIKTILEKGSDRRR